MSLGLSLGVESDSDKNFSTSWNQSSLEFDGSNDYIDLAGTITTSLAEAFLVEESNQVNMSFSAWVKGDTMSTTGVIFNLRVGTSSDNHIICMYHGSGNNLRFTAKFDGTAEVCADGTLASVATGGSFENGGWHHLAGTISHGETQIDFWINGTKVDSQNIAQTLQGAVSTLTVGSNTSGAALWNGKIDEFAIWNRVLTGTEITSLYNAKAVDGSGDAAIPFHQHPSLKDGLEVYLDAEDTSDAAKTVNLAEDRPYNLANGVSYSNDVM